MGDTAKREIRRRLKELTFAINAAVERQEMSYEDAQYGGVLIAKDTCAGTSFFIEQPSLQKRIYDWVCECLGKTVADSIPERNHRFLEEALELVQAAGCTKEEALQLVDYVYERPVGDLPQEVGGALLTLAALAETHGISMQEEAEKDLARIQANMEQIKRKHAQKPSFLP